jgi:hypothetical protein
MRYKLRTLFIAVLIFAIAFSVVAFIQQAWFIPVRIGTAAQSQLDVVFAKHNWQGYAGTWHYDCRVRIASPDVGDSEVTELLPILRDIPWLKHIELYGTSLTEDGISSMKDEFPDCYFTIKDGPPFFD